MPELVDATLLLVALVGTHGPLAQDYLTYIPPLQ